MAGNSRLSAQRAKRAASTCTGDECELPTATADHEYCWTHLLHFSPAAWAEAKAASGELVGITEPRLWTRPLRPLTRETSHGYEVIEFARDVLGEPLLPWQEWLAIHALELDPAGGYRFRTVVALVARQNGKTHLSKVIALWRLYVAGARLVLGAAQDLSIAREVLELAEETALAVPDLAVEVAECRKTNGDEQLKLTGGGRYKIAATTGKAGRGLTVDHLTMDEIREQRDWKAWSALSKTITARMWGQIWTLSNAGDIESVVLNTLRDNALSERDPSIGVFEWSGEDDCELDDRQAWRQANPALGITISERALATSLGTDPPEVFRTEVLCQRVDSLDTAVNAGAWAAGADSRGNMDKLRDRVYLCLDVALDGAHVILVAAAETKDGRYRVEPVASWNTVEEARGRVAYWIKRIKPRGGAWYPTGPAAELTGDIPEDWVRITGTEVVAACMAFSSLVTGGRIVHPNDALLNAHVGGSKKYPQGDGWRFVRRGVGHVNGAYAAAGAVHTIRNHPGEAALPEPQVV